MDRPQAARPRKTSRGKAPAARTSEAPSATKSKSTRLKKSSAKALALSKTSKAKRKARRSTAVRSALVTSGTDKTTKAARRRSTETAAKTKKGSPQRARSIPLRPVLASSPNVSATPPNSSLVEAATADAAAAVDPLPEASRRPIDPTLPPANASAPAAPEPSLFPLPPAPPVQPLSASSAVVAPLSTVENHGFRELVEEFLRGRSRNTVEAYRRDLLDFAAFLGVVTIDEAARALLSHGHGAANRVVLRYKNTLLERSPRPRWPAKHQNPPTTGSSEAQTKRYLAPATVARRLAAVRSLVTLARLLGMVEWTVDVASPKAERVRDVRGPRLDGLRAIKNGLESRHGPKALRDSAILRLAYDLGLRRAEVCELDLEHLDNPGKISIKGKGRRGRETLSLPTPTMAAISAWLEARGREPGPLFVSMDRARKGNGRLTPNGLYSVIRNVGERVDVRARPHGLRHSAITAAMDAFGGDLRKVAKFSRHNDWRTLATYYDEWKDDAGEVAKRVAGSL